MRMLTLGGRVIDGWVEVTEGLRPGDRLIVGDPPGLKEGVRVRVTGEGTPRTGEGGPR
jgi:hypothetical protein